jgi:hypothetical protein
MHQIALSFLAAHGLTLPLAADVALFAAGFWPLPAPGPASLDGNILRYDEAWPGWEAAVWHLVCGRILENAGYPNGPGLRAELARGFGVVLHVPHAAGAR